MKLETVLFLFVSKFCASKSGVRLIYGCSLYTDVYGSYNTSEMKQTSLVSTGAETTCFKRNCTCKTCRKLMINSITLLTWRNQSINNHNNNNNNETHCQLIPYCALLNYQALQGCSIVSLRAGTSPASGHLLALKSMIWLKFYFTWAKWLVSANKEPFSSSCSSSRSCSLSWSDL